VQRDVDGDVALVAANVEDAFVCKQVRGEGGEQLQACVEDVAGGHDAKGAVGAGIAWGVSGGGGGLKGTGGGTLIITVDGGHGGGSWGEAGKRLQGGRRR